MSELILCAITIKNTNIIQVKKSNIRFKNILKMEFTTTYINEKWGEDIAYIHTIKDDCYYLASVLDLHSKKIIGYDFSKRMTKNLVSKALKNTYYRQLPNKNKLLIFH